MGTDGGLPTRTINWYILLLEKFTISIPTTKMNDLYNPNLFATNVYFSRDRKRLYIDMINSDGAGGYEVTWIIQDKKYSRRVIGYGF